MVDRNLRRYGTVLALGGSLVSNAARAADTIETWDVGPSDVEIYGGADGLGPHPAEHVVWSSALLGFGLVERLSACIGMTLSADEALGNGQAAFHIGLLGTPIDTDHFDLDIVFLSELGGDGLSELQLGPLVELNADADPERRSWGAYLRAGLPVRCRTGAGAELEDSTAVATDDDPVAWAIGVTPAGYVHLTEEHEVLVEVDFTFAANPAPGDPTVEVGRIALGNNTLVSPAIELITEVALDIPQDGEPWAVGMMAGLVATLPSASSE